MKGKQDPCGQWILREKQHLLFAKEVLKNIEQSHDAFHATAHSIMQKYQSGQLDVARNNLAELQVAFDNMTHALLKCK